MFNNFELEYNTIWSFKERGAWSTHKGDYPGNCSPKVIKNLLLKYSKENDLILDQFVGSGTTIIESILNKRKCIGIDVNEKALNIVKNRINKLKGSVRILKGDARKLDLKDEYIDFICTHPPYWNIIKYSNNINEDLSLLDLKGFYKAMTIVSKECFRVLKKDKFCAIIIGDIRKKGYIEPLGFNIMNVFLNQGFKLKEVIIKEQHNCSSTEKWINIAKKNNFLLIKHEYIFILKKPTK